VQRYYREHQQELDKEDRLLRARNTEQKNPAFHFFFTKFKA